jgi:hypothetical protein
MARRQIKVKLRNDQKSVCYNQPFIQAQLLLNAPSALIYNNYALCAYNVFVFCMIITTEWLFQNSSKWLVAVTGGCYSGVAKVSC